MELVFRFHGFGVSGRPGFTGGDMVRVEKCFAGQSEAWKRGREALSEHAMATEAPPQKPAKKPRLNAAAWEKVRSLYEHGETIAELCRAFRLSESGIRAKLQKQGWERKMKGGGEKRGNRGAAANESAPSGLAGTTETGLSAMFDLSDPPEVQELAGFPSIPANLNPSPEEFQALVSTYAKALLQQGSKVIEPPKTAAEFKTWFDIIRKADGLDAKDKNGQAPGLVKPMRTLSRRTVEAELVELAAELPDVDLGAFD